MQADAADKASLEAAFGGVHGVYNVQNHHISGYEGEIDQGRKVADAVAAVPHAEVALRALHGH